MNYSLIPLYELKRLTFLLGYIQNPKQFRDALAFAYYNRLSPLFHQAAEKETYDLDPFEEIYAVKSDFISEVLKYVEECENKGDYAAIGFYNLETKFGGHHNNRVELIHTLEYARIDGRFDNRVWQAIEANAPIEAKPLESTFSPTDVSFG